MPFALPGQAILTIGGRRQAWPPVTDQPSVSLGFSDGVFMLEGTYYSDLSDVPGLTYTRTGAATAWRNDGTLVEFAPNVMRRTDAGVTIEVRRTNLLVNSAWAGGAKLTGWSSIGPGSDAASTTLSTVRARDFVASASRTYVIATGSVVSMDPGATYCLSVVVEAISGGIKASEVLHHGYVPADVVLSYPACPANPSGGASGIVQPGRLHILATSAGGGAAIQWRVGLGVLNNVTGTARLSLPQLELGTHASTPIITTGAAATVGADNLALAKTIAAGEDFTVVVDCLFSVIETGTVFNINDGSGNNRVYLRRSGSGAIQATVTVGGVAQSTTQIPWTTGLAKCALRRSGSVITLAVNGAIIGSAVGYVSPSLSKFDFGTVVPVFPRMALLPQALTDSDLVRLTQ